MTTESTPVMVCKNHPTRETGLRCNRCDEPICATCAMRTPTGYRCPQCVKEQQKVFDTAEVPDYLVATLVAGAMSFVGGLLATAFGWFIIFVAAFGGGIIAEAVRRVLKGRRSKRLFRIIAGATFVGGILPALPNVLGGIMFLAMGELGGLAAAGFSLLWPLIYAGIAASTVYVRISGIQIGQ